MEKGNIIAKLNIKDYSKMLEEILAKKLFSEDTKNILLSMIYKIENSYSDYKKVKVNVLPKKEIMEEVIESIEKCKNIKIIKPKKKGEDLKECKIDTDQMKIETYPNEMTILYALYRLNEKQYDEVEENDIITPSVRSILNDGRAMDISEIIRDFDGWSWNLNKDNIEDIFVNFIYQTINTVVDIETIDGEDIINSINKELNRKASSQTAQKYIELLIKLSMKYMICENIKEKERLEKVQQKAKNELAEMLDKKGYLEKITHNKKKIQKELAKIEMALNDDVMLKTKFLNTNKELPPEKKIFSLSDFSEIQENKKESLIKELEEYNKKQDPENYLKEKERLAKKN